MFEVGLVIFVSVVALDVDLVLLMYGTSSG